MGKPRYIYGVAYNAGIKERRTTRCSAQAYHSNDPDIFYSDEAVRYTYDELRALNLEGKPICVHHHPELRIGTIIWNKVDDRGDLRIIAEISDETHLGRAMIKEIDNGTLGGLSVGYTNVIDPQTRKIEHKIFDEVSVVVEPHFPNCTVAVRASKKSDYKSPAPLLSFKVVKAAAKMEQQQQQQQQPPAAQDDPMDVEKPDVSKSGNDDAQELVRDIAEMKKKLEDAEQALKQREEESARIREQNEFYLKQDEERRQRYAEANKPSADKAVEYLKKVFSQANNSVMSEHFEKGIRDAIMSPEGSEMKTMAVTAARITDDLETANEDLKKKVEELQRVITISRDATKLDNQQQDDEDQQQRDIKRSLKVAKRREGVSKKGLDTIMEPKQQQQPPAWIHNLGVPSNTFTPNTGGMMSRSVNAGATLWKQEPATSDDEQVQPPTPMKTGMRVYPNSMRNNPDTRDMFHFIKNAAVGPGMKVHTHLAGQTIGNPNQIGH